jgi:hypothetical protein
MHYLVIDTCVWIDLGRKFTEVRENLSKLIDRGEVRLILPQIVVDEWDKHKQSKIAESKKQSIRGKIKNARSLFLYLPPGDADDLTRILDQIRETEIEIMAQEGIAAIESLLDHPSTIRLPVTDKARLQAVELALTRKAPFHNKNSMADALIILCAADYVTQESLSNCVFVSSNTTDFALDSDIHPDLKELFDKSGIRYFSNIGLAINEIEEDLVSRESVEGVERALRIAAMREALARQRVEWFRKMADLASAREMYESVARQQAEWFRKMADLAPAREIYESIARQQAEWFRKMADLAPAREIYESAARQQAEWSRKIADWALSSTRGMYESVASQQEETKESTKPETVYVGSVKGDRFHFTSCKHAGRLLSENRITFTSKEEAIAKGYKPCRACRP